jgi:hypothetical protein
MAGLSAGLPAARAVALVFGAKLTFQGIEAAFPCLFCFRDPRLEFVEPRGIQRLNSPLAVHPHIDEPGPPQDLQVLRYGRGGHGEFLYDLARSAIPGREHLYDVATGRVGKCGDTEHAGNNKVIS